MWCLIDWFDRQRMWVQVLLALLFIYTVHALFLGSYRVPSESMETTILVGERVLVEKCTPLLKRMWRRGIALLTAGRIRKHTPLFKRGDIVTFSDPTYPYADNRLLYWWQRYVWGPAYWTKRVVGVPGDHVVGIIEHNKTAVYVNGKRFIEPYVNRYPLLALWDDCVGLTGERRDGACLVYRSYDPKRSLTDQPFYRIDQRLLVKNMTVPHVLYSGTPLDALSNRRHGASDLFDVKLGPGEYWVMGDNRLASQDGRYWGVLREELIHGRVFFCTLSIDDGAARPFLWRLITAPCDTWSRIRWNRSFRFVSAPCLSGV